MELTNIIRILWRWSWLIASIVVLTGFALFLGLLLGKPTYQAEVKVQLSTPQQEDVAVYDQYRSVNTRDLITVARNNFESLLKSEEVRNRTFQELNLDPEKIDYEIDTKSSADSDFVYVTVRAPSSPLVAAIANAHVRQAINYYGELRAKPTIEEKDLYAEQLKTAEEAYRTAADTFTTFKAENKIGVLGNDIATIERLLEQLQAERDQRILETDVKDSVSQVNELITQRKIELDRLLALEPMYLILEENYQQAREKYRDALPFGVQSPTFKVADKNYQNAAKAFNEFKIQNNITSLQIELALNNELLKKLQTDLDQLLVGESNKTEVINQLDELILQYKKDLDRLSGLQTTYNVLEEKANEAQDKHQHILSKYSEAELKATVVRAANFIQVIESAQEPTKPLSNSLRLFVLGIIGSLGLGIILAFLLDYLTEKGEKDLIPEKLKRTDSGESPRIEI